MPGDVTRLRRLLGGSDTQWLLGRVRDRIAQGQAGPLEGTVQLREPSPDQRAAAMRLVGPPHRPGRTLRVDLGELEDLLRRGAWPAGLADAVTVLTGPVSNRPRERAAADAAWTRATQAFSAAVLAHPALEPWWSQWCAAGQLKRAARSGAAARDGGARPDLPDAARQLASTAAACLCALPSAGEPLAVFARRITGDAHGLDRSRPLGRLVLAAVGALREGSATDLVDVDLAGGRATAPDDSLGPRELWATVGLLVSNVSSTVLCLGVPGGPATGERAGAANATATALDAWRGAGVPVVLTLDQVRSGGVGVVPADGIVHVCENPSVVEVVAEAAAPDQLTPARSRSRPGPVLVCTAGQPGAAVFELLAQLVADGAQVRYHGDFDWAGLRIAATLATRIPWQPWRFSAPDYAAAVAGPGPDDEPDGAEAPADRQHLALRGAPAASPWDPALADAMRAGGVAIEEEEVVAHLVADLRRLRGPSGP